MLEKIITFPYNHFYKFKLSLKEPLLSHIAMTDTNSTVPSSGQAAAAGGADAQHINIKVKAQDGTEIFFKIKRTTQLKKLMDAYCTRQGLSAN